ncbi:hypothetical protein RMATCC62417_14578 [Rhizopus microsporus]|nr:hypothetical protein RMATCC62417_14578 [Rhizopus microsporus]
MLKLTEDGVYVASLLSKLIVPKNLSNLNMFKQTLDYLLKMKAFLLDTTKILKRALFQKEINQLIPALPAPTNSSRRLSRASAGHIYLAPKTNQTKKTDLYDSPYDE